MCELRGSRRCFRARSLLPLPEEEAVRFVIEQFKAGGKECPREIASQIISITQAYPFYVQRVSGEIFTRARKEEIGEQELQEGIRSMLEQEERYYASIERALPAGQKKLLRALAKEPAESPYAVDYQRKHRLGSLSAIKGNARLRGQYTRNRRTQIILSGCIDHYDS